MTNEQALEILEHNWTKLVNPDCTDEELGQALDIAIKALEENEKLKDKEHRTFVNAQNVISRLIEENKALRGEE